MKTLLSIFALAAMACAAQAGDKTVTIAARLNTPVISVRGGQIFVHLTVGTPRFEERRREPLNLSVVLDRSGSMGDERKIEYARKALQKLIDELNENDIFSLVVYDDYIDVLRNPSRVGNKRGLKALIDGIEPRGSTNLGGGMIQGLELASQFVQKGYVNRVVLLSDGLANQGITSPHELNRIVRQYRHRGISMTTMGVGLDYNENLMVGLAENGGGNYYFIESPRQLASIMAKELDYVSSVVCRDAVIELRLGSGVRLKDVVGYEWKQEGEKTVVSLGDLYSDENRELTVELEAPKGSGSIALAEGTIAFQSDKVSAPTKGFAAEARYTEDEKVVEEHRDLTVQAKADVAVSTRRVEKALQALDEGREEDAAAELQEAEAFLNASPAASAQGAGGDALRAQMGRLSSFQDSVKSGDLKKAKKDIQYKNYQLQKNKQ